MAIKKIKKIMIKKIKKNEKIIWIKKYIQNWKNLVIKTSGLYELISAVTSKLPYLVNIDVTARPLSKSPMHKSTIYNVLGEEKVTVFYDTVNSLFQYLNNLGPNGIVFFFIFLVFLAVYILMLPFLFIRFLFRLYSLKKKNGYVSIRLYVQFLTNLYSKRYRFVKNWTYKFFKFFYQLVKFFYQLVKFYFLFDRKKILTNIFFFEKIRNINQPPKKKQWKIKIYFDRVRGVTQKDPDQKGYIDFFKNQEKRGKASLEEKGTFSNILIIIWTLNICYHVREGTMPVTLFQTKFFWKILDELFRWKDDVTLIHYLFFMWLMIVIYIILCRLLQPLIFFLITKIKKKKLKSELVKDFRNWFWLSEVLAWYFVKKPSFFFKSSRFRLFYFCYYVYVLLIRIDDFVIRWTYYNKILVPEGTNANWYLLADILKSQTYWDDIFLFTDIFWWPVYLSVLSYFFWSGKYFVLPALKKFFSKFFKILKKILNFFKTFLKFWKNFFLKFKKVKIIFLKFKILKKPKGFKKIIFLKFKRFWKKKHK